jgi:hypothetical protein
MTWACDRCGENERPGHWRELDDRSVCSNCWAKFAVWWAEGKDPLKPLRDVDVPYAFGGVP